MKTRYLFCFLISFLFITSNRGIAQVVSEKEDTVQAGIDDYSIVKTLSEKKPRFNISIGTVFGTGSGLGNYFGTYISPQVSYPVSSRFMLNTGVTIMNGFPVYAFGSPYDNEFYDPFSTGTNSIVYVGGDYKLSDNLTLSGSVYKGFSMYRNPRNDQHGYNNNIEGMMLGVGYKVGKNAFIQGQIEISNGRNPYFRHPFHSPVNSFNQSPFQSGWIPY